MREENLVKDQMKTISDLQEKIKLLQFDISENLKEIRYLKDIMLRRKNTNKNAIKSLEEMKKKKDFNNIDYVICVLKNSYSREPVDYDEK